MPTIFDKHTPVLKLTQTYVDRFFGGIVLRPISRILAFLADRVGWGPIADYALNELCYGDKSFEKLNDVDCIYPDGVNSIDILRVLISVVGADTLIKTIVQIEESNQQKGDTDA